MASSNQEKSILSAIPKDITFIIKDFNLEKREQSALKINSGSDNFYITKYKEGYKIDKTLSIKRFDEKIVILNLTEEEKQSIITRINKEIKKNFPIFLDDVDDVIQYMYTQFYDEYDYLEDDEDSSQAHDSQRTTLHMSGCMTHCNVIDFERKLTLYMKSVGKVYKKTN